MKSLLASLNSVSSQQEIMVGSMYQAETPAGLCKYKDNEKGEVVCLIFNICKFERNQTKVVLVTQGWHVNAWCL